MRGEDDDCMPESLETHSCIDDQTLSTTNAKIRVKEHDRLRRYRHFSTGDEMSLWALHAATRRADCSSGLRKLVSLSALALFQVSAVGDPWLQHAGPSTSRVQRDVKYSYHGTRMFHQRPRQVSFTFLHPFALPRALDPDPWD